MSVLASCMRNVPAQFPDKFMWLQAVWSVAFHDLGDFVATASMDHTARLFDVHTYVHTYTVPFNFFALRLGSLLLSLQVLSLIFGTYVFLQGQVPTDVPRTHRLGQLRRLPAVYQCAGHMRCRQNHFAVGRTYGCLSVIAVRSYGSVPRSGVQLPRTCLFSFVLFVVFSLCSLFVSRSLFCLDVFVYVRVFGCICCLLLTPLRDVLVFVFVCL